ncbi:MAG: hypothetical protein NT062_22895, partial [Proteobacteria bacterium]|nr:hypothetical protein [Pseudomonadota bacterium]
MRDPGHVGLLPGGRELPFEAVDRDRAPRHGPQGGREQCEDHHEMKFRRSLHEAREPPAVRRA